MTIWLAVRSSASGVEIFKEHNFTTEERLGQVEGGGEGSLILLRGQVHRHYRDVEDADSDGLNVSHC